jgi:hypothetical protein
MSPEVCSPGRMLALSPCPERSWQRVRLPACTEPSSTGERALNRRKPEACGEPLVVSLLAYAEPIAASVGMVHFAHPAVQNYSTHVSSNFRANPLKTNDACTYKVTHKARGVSHERWPFGERLWFSNRKLPLLEGGSTRRKQTTALRSNRKFSRVAPRSLATNHSVTSHCTRLPESRRSRPASDSLSGGII